MDDAFLESGYESQHNQGQNVAPDDHRCTVTAIKSFISVCRGLHRQYGTSVHEARLRTQAGPKDWTLVFM